MPSCCHQSLPPRFSKHVWDPPLPGSLTHSLSLLLRGTLLSLTQGPGVSGQLLVGPRSHRWPADLGEALVLFALGGGVSSWTWVSSSPAGWSTEWRGAGWGQETDQQWVLLGCLSATPWLPSPHIKWQSNGDSQCRTRGQPAPT